MREAPFYDPVFIAEDKRDDPDVVLEARAELWNVDRITHELTSSNVLVGEDGNEDFLDSEVPYDSVTVRLNQPPLRSVSVIGAVSWTQAGKGSVSIKQSAGYPTYTGDGLISEWPKTGSDMGGGWKVATGTAVDIAGIATIDPDAVPNRRHDSAVRASMAGRLAGFTDTEMVVCQCQQAGSHPGSAVACRGHFAHLV